MFEIKGSCVNNFYIFDIENGSYLLNDGNICDEGRTWEDLRVFYFRSHEEAQEALNNYLNPEFKTITVGGKHYVYKGNGYTPGTYLTNTGEVRQIDLCDILDQYYFPSREAAQAALDKYLSSTIYKVIIGGKTVYEGPTRPEVILERSVTKVINVTDTESSKLF